MKSESDLRKEKKLLRNHRAVFRYNIPIAFYLVVIVAMLGISNVISRDVLFLDYVLLPVFLAIFLFLVILPLWKTSPFLNKDLKNKWISSELTYYHSRSIRPLAIHALISISVIYWGVFFFEKYFDAFNIYIIAYALVIFLPVLVWLYIGKKMSEDGDRYLDGWMRSYKMKIQETFPRLEGSLQGGNVSYEKSISAGRFPGIWKEVQNVPNRGLTRIEYILKGYGSKIEVVGYPDRSFSTVYILPEGKSNLTAFDDFKTLFKDIEE